MTDILGLVGSARLWGNSELLVRQVLRGAQAEGASAQAVRLTDLQLGSCIGCMRCVIGDRPCPVDDDMSWLLEVIQAADGLVLGAPTYFLGPAAVIKLVLDRLLMVAGRVDEPLPPLRPAITVATAGLEGWRGVTLPYLNALAMTLGFQPIESVTAIAPGPGEVLLDEGLLARVFAAGRRLGCGELERAPTPPDVCPICHCDSFVLTGDQATCPICGQEAAVEGTEDGVALCFDTVDLGNGTEQPRHRWTPEGMRTHMIEWVMATGPRFMARRRDIKARRQPYREMDVSWLCPPSP
jgi:multimeric flavodoxin WrbA